jgi:hypothetical protein
VITLTKANAAGIALSDLKATAWTEAVVVEAPIFGRTPEKVRLMTRFSVKMTAECQADCGDGFPGRRSCAKKLPHRRV